MEYNTTPSFSVQMAELLELSFQQSVITESNIGAFYLSFLFQCFKFKELQARNLLRYHAH